MKTLLKAFALCALMIAIVSSAAMARETKFPMVKHLYNGNWPSEQEGQQLRDELFYSYAILAYMTMLPALNTIGLRDGSEAAFGAGYNVIPVWKDRMDSRAWVPTPNADVVYAMSYMNLAETGPLVVAAPPGIIGMFTDFFQRTITDVGAVGPDRARGGLYLLLPPDYSGYVPDGYFTFKSRTNNVFLFFRAVMGKGKNGVGVDPTPGVKTQEKNGELLSGSNTYKFRLPAGIPAKAFWAVTLYNISDGTMIETDQLIPGVNGYDDTAKNKDGSIDLYFGPIKPEGVADSNYIKTIKGRAFLTGLRIYGSAVEFFDQTWIPDDVVKVK